MTGGDLLSPGARVKKKQETVSDFLPGGAAGGRLVFSFESSGQIGPMLDGSINWNLQDSTIFQNPQI
jgi:hypothetical protein